MAFFYTGSVFSQPYKLPIPSNVNPDSISLYDLHNHISEVALTEYIAYTQGLPVTASLLRAFFLRMGWGWKSAGNPPKLLGNVVFVCSDGKCDTELDLSTLARHFELIDEVREVIVIEEGKDIVIPLSSFTIDEIESVIEGMHFMPGESYSLSSCYRLLHFLRPKDTSYYMRYDQKMGEKGLKVGEGEISEKETVEFMREVSLGLNDGTKAHLCEYNRIANSTIFGPIITHLTIYLSDDNRQLVRLLLADMPSSYLYWICLNYSETNYPPYKRMIVDVVRTIQLTDGLGILREDEWLTIQKSLYDCINTTTKKDEFLRVMALTGNTKFPRPEGFKCPKLPLYYKPDLVIHMQPWMDDDIKREIHAQYMK